MQYYKYYHNNLLFPYNIPIIDDVYGYILFHFDFTKKKQKNATHKTSIIKIYKNLVLGFFFNLITFSTNNSVKITDEAQFGISPTKLARIGPKILLLLKILLIVSSPIKCINKFSIKDTIIINTNILYYKYNHK